MPEYRVNQPGVDKAKSMIDAGQYDIDTEWGDGAPTADEGTDQIDRHGYEGYGEWHLAIDTEASEDTKDRYAFPFGDFRRVHRSALIHAKQRASQNDHDAIVDIADEVLSTLDATRS